MTDRKSSDTLVALAQRVMREPHNATDYEVKRLAGSVLSQARPGPMARLRRLITGG